MLVVMLRPCYFLGEILNDVRGTGSIGVRCDVHSEVKCSDLVGVQGEVRALNSMCLNLQ